MNMILPQSVSATPNGTTRPQVRIVIVGHVDHGKSTLVGRLLHETGSLPDGKLEMLKAVSGRRGMAFEWSFLLDALQTERDQGITIDTTQIRFRTPSRDVVLIDAPGHAEFMRNMVTGASQADAALLLVDAAAGMRDQTRPGRGPRGAGGAPGGAPAPPPPPARAPAAPARRAPARRGGQQDGPRRL